jgi:hypothetical protein
MSIHVYHDVSKSTFGVGFHVQLSYIPAEQMVFCCNPLDQIGALMHTFVDTVFRFAVSLVLILLGTECGPISALESQAPMMHILSQKALRKFELYDLLHCVCDSVSVPNVVGKINFCQVTFQCR